MAHPSAHTQRLPADLHSNHLHAAAHQTSAAVGLNSSASAAAGVAPNSAIYNRRPDVGRPHFRGHQRRQSVARLLPDISKLRLLSWLVEASNELISCDIAIMDGVYAKLNRSRESLLFWQQHQSQAAAAGQQRPPLPPPPYSQPAASKIVISHQQQQQQQQQQRQQQRQQESKKSNKSQLLLGNNDLRRNKSNSLATGGADSSISKSAAGCSAGGSQRSARNHHSLPLTNYDASSLAAISLGRADQVDSNASRSACNSLLADSPASSSIQMLQQQMLERAVALKGQPGPGSPSGGNSAPRADFCDSNSQSDVDEADVEGDDEDDHSSAASSTTSSGIHNASMSSASSSASTSSSASSSSGASSSSEGSGEPFESGHARPPADAQLLERQRQQHHHQEQPPIQSSAEQLSERIRQAVMEHNYLQNLLVNVIRQHDRQRDLINARRRAQSLLQKRNTQQNNDERHSFKGSPLAPRIDLADIADSLDDGCQCSCHSARLHSSANVDCSLSMMSSVSSSSKRIGSRASTLPSSSSLNLFQPSPLPSSAGASVAASNSGRKNRRKKNTCEPSREDILRKLSDKLCENCLETHYWLSSCSTIETVAPVVKPPRSKSSAATAAANHLRSDDSMVDCHSPSITSSAAANSTSPTSAALAQQNSEAVVALRNATFIKLVQQQVRSTISRSIELIDLIRKEIKSPESIKQKQLMRCFSASIQLLSSVASYVVPSQDISTFIPTEIMRNSPAAATSSSPQASILFSLPPNDFDHPLLYPGSYSAASTSFPAAANYHLAPAPEIPVRRRHQRLRRSSEDSASFATHTDDDHDSFRSLPLTAANSSPATPLKMAPPKRPPHSADSDKKQREIAAAKMSAAAATSDLGARLGNSAASVAVESSSGASSNNSSASSSIARGQVQQPSLTKAHTPSAILDANTNRHDDRLSFERLASQFTQQQPDDDLLAGFQSGRAKFWQSSKFNFIKKLLQVKQQRLLRQQSKDRRIYNNKVQNKFRLVMMDLTHFNKSQQLLTTENGVNSLLTSMRNVLEFGLYLTVKLY